MTWRTGSSSIADTTNEKVSQLAIAHESIRNAVTALVVELFILSGLFVWESLTLP